MQMICVGKSSGKPKFGCPYCSACTPYLEEGILYTLEDIINLHQSFLEEGSNLRNQSLYQNIINASLITGSPEEKVIEIISVPELHLLLGIVEKFIKEFQNKVFPSKEMGKAFLDNFLKKVNIVKKEYQ